MFGADEDANNGPESGDVRPLAYPDTLVGTDSHTPMVNGLGVLGWGVGGIEAEAAMLGQPISMLIPEVVGFKLTGKLREGATATDLVLTVTQLLRKKGVVGRFVEFYGPGVGNVPVVDRATIGNMSPEYGSTCAIFPVDGATLDYLRLTGRSEERVALVEAYMKAQGLFHDSAAPEPIFSDTLELDLGDVEPSIAGPGRPQDRVPLGRAKAAFEASLPSLLPPEPPRSQKGADARTSPEERLNVWGESAAGAGPSGRDCSRTWAGPTSGARLHRDRRDHELHQHLESLGHAGGRPARQARGRTRTEAAALGEDVSRPRLAGRDGLLRARRAHALSRSARLQPGRLRLHHLHRQFRAAPDRDLRGDPAQESRRRRRRCPETGTSRAASIRKCAPII